MAFPVTQQGRRTERLISELNTRPACTRANASPGTSRLPAHDCGPGWGANPSLYGSFIRDSKPVLTGAFWVSKSNGQHERTNARLRLVRLSGSVPHRNDPHRLLLHSIEETVRGYDDLSKREVRKLGEFAS